MAQASVISTRTASISMGHVCSRCKAIVLQSVVIDVKCAEFYSIGRKKAEAIASEGSMNALKRMIEKINSCNQTSFVLQDGPLTVGSGNVMLLGASATCPCCGMLEPWQDPAAAYEDRAALDKIQFPIILDPNMAPKWVQLIISQFNEQINFARRDVGRIMAAEERAKEIQAELDALSSELRTLPAYEKKASLMAEIDALTVRLNDLRFSSFKEKREISGQLRTTKKELKATETVIQSETDRVKAQIASKRAEYRQMAAVAYGYTGKVTKIVQGGATYFELEVNFPK